MACEDMAEDISGNSNQWRYHPLTSFYFIRRAYIWEFHKTMPGSAIDAGHRSEDYLPAFFMRLWSKIIVQSMIVSMITTVYFN